MTPDDAERSLLQDIERVRAMRTFDVLLMTGQTVRVRAHFHENTNPAGHLNFYTYSGNGHTMARQSYSCRMWMTLTEVDPQDYMGEALN